MVRYTYELKAKMPLLSPHKHYSTMEFFTSHTPAKDVGVGAQGQLNVNIIVECLELTVIVNVQKLLRINFSIQATNTQ